MYYQHQALQHAVEETIDNEPIKVLTVEDVIVHKLIAGRYQDLADIEAILATNFDLDQEYIENWADFWDVFDRWEEVQTSLP